VSRQTAQEVRLIGQAKIAACKLYTLRFKNIWETNTARLFLSSNFAWKFLIHMEQLKEISKQKYLIVQKKQEKDLLFTHMAYGSFFRLRFLALEGMLWFVRAHINRSHFSMHLLPIPTQELENLVLFGLSRNGLKSKRLN